MGFFRLLWRLARRRWVRRVLLWLVVRLIRLFGWRRAVKLLFRGRRRWRFLALGVWRAAVRLLRLGRSAWVLIGWVGARTPRRLVDGREARRAPVLLGGWRLRAADALGIRPLPREVRTSLPSRLARRRDELRRAVLTAVGVDPEWRPAREARGGERSSIGGESRPQLSDNIPE